MVLDFLISLSACITFLGVLRVEARPFPEPIGIIPSPTLVPTRLLATSLTVPSPPQATTISAPSITDLAAKIFACLGPFVCFILTSKKKIIICDNKIF